MKKRPSLLDIELFAGKRAEEKQDALQKIEEASDAAVFESLTRENTPPEPLPERSVSSQVMDERLDSLIEVTDVHRNEIDKLKQDLFKVKEQLRVYHSFLNTQQKKITELEARPMKQERQGGVDVNYIKLLLKNVVWLKEERDFSSNDVSRLFRAEGFEIPHPYEQWDADMIDILYHEAKKSFL